MDELKKRLSQKKRSRPQSGAKMDENNKKNFVVAQNNIEYFIRVKISKSTSKIIIECVPGNTFITYEIKLELESLKEENRIFNVCQNLEDAYKVITNIFSKKKSDNIRSNYRRRMSVFSFNNT